MTAILSLAPFQQRQLWERASEIERMKPWMRCWIGWKRA